jgi:hypothetical protein
VRKRAVFTASLLPCDLLTMLQTLRGSLDFLDGSRFDRNH